MEIQDIQQAIQQFEKSESTPDNVQELACLYTVRNNLLEAKNSTEAQLTDILPEYRRYCDCKRKFQLHQLTEDAVIEGMDRVCTELQEFVSTLYSCTDFYKERKILLQAIEDLNTQLNRQEEEL